MSYYNLSNTNDVLLWLEKNNQFVNYDSLPHLFDLFEQLTNDKYNKYTYVFTAAQILKYLNKTTIQYNLDNNEHFGLISEYYDMILRNKSISFSKYTFYFLEPFLFLNKFEAGQNKLTEFGFNFSRPSKFRDAAFQHHIKGSLNTLIEFSPQKIDSKNLLEKHLSITICQFLNYNNIEIPKKYLINLALDLFHFTYNYLNISQLETRMSILTHFGDLLLNNSNFVNQIAPAKNINLAIYNYFDKKIPLPKDLNSKHYNLSADHEIVAYMQNEFSKKLYNHPGFKFKNLNQKLQFQANLKHSGKKFVNSETQAENLQKDLSSLKESPKKNKI